MKPRLYKKYETVSTIKRARQLLRAVAKTGPIALDIETTSLRPSEGRVRLMQFCNDKHRFIIDMFKIRGGLKTLAKDVEKCEVYVFNVGFEGRWLRHANGGAYKTRQVRDIAHMRRSVLGGGNFSLKLMVLWDLDIAMDKTEQSSNWAAKELTKSQLDYAWWDAAVTWAGFKKWDREMKPHHWGAFHLLNDMWPAVSEMEDSGMKLNSKTHSKLLKAWTAERDDLQKQIRGMVAEDEVKNINSDAQWNDYFAARLPDDFLQGWPRTEKTGRLSMKKEHVLMLAGAAGPGMLRDFFNVIVKYKWVSKYISSFGDTLLNAAALNGDNKVHARFNVGAAKTLRYSCSGPNLQQIPRDQEWHGKRMSVRDSFVAGMGRELVSLDYSGIELRVLGLLANDQQLIDDMVEGDIHSEVASKMMGRTITPASCKKNKKDKAARSGAKPVSFGIIYGSAAFGLSNTLGTDVGTAQDYIDFWADRYPNAFDYRNQMMEAAGATGFLPMVDGGTIYVGKRVAMPKAANYPVQRAAWSIMARAIARHKTTLDEERGHNRQRMTRLLSTIHDALIDEAAKKDGKRLLKLMEHDMVQGYLDIFPGAPIERLVEGGTGPSWGKLD